MFLLVLSFFVVQPFLQALVFGALLAYIFYPVYLFFLDKFKNKTAAGLVVCFLVALVFVIPGFFFVKTLVQESYVLFISVKQRLATGFFSECTNGLCQIFETLTLNNDLGGQVQDVIRDVTNWIIQRGSNFLISLPRFFLNLFVVLFTMFYFMKDGKRLMFRIHRFLVHQDRKYENIFVRLREIVHGVVFGYLTIGLIQGMVGALGFFIFGISSPILWGLIMAFLALIPFVGTGIIWAPAALILFFEGVFSNSNWLIFKGVGLFVYGLVFVAGIDNVLRPKLMGNKAKIHPAIVMLGIFGGLLAFGPTGVLTGPLILSLAYVVGRTYFGKPALPKRESD